MRHWVLVLAGIGFYVLWFYGVQSETERPEMRTVDARVLNVRAGPGTEHDVIGQVEQDRRVEILEERQGWARIRAGRTEGWASTRYLARIFEVAKPSPPPRPRKPEFCGELSLEILEPVIYKIDPELRRVYVNRVWYTRPYDQKQAMALYFGECHGLTHVLDAFTGEEVAGLGWGGPKVHR